VIFSILLILTLLVFAAGSLYQVHRRKTPFYVTVQRDDVEKQVKVYVGRRAFASWPAEAYEVYRRHTIVYRGYNGLDDDNNFKVLVNKVSADDPDADEQVIEAVVEANSFADRWGKSKELDALYKQARKALKR